MPRRTLERIRSEISDGHILGSGTGILPVSLSFIEDASQVIKKRHGAYLPQWTKEGGTYAVTFGLADSLPASVLAGWRIEREDIIKTAQQVKRPLSSQERKRLARLFSERVDRHLNAGRGACHLKNPEVAQLVSTALYRFNDVRYILACWCIMPNHVHVIVKPLGENPLSRILHSWKSFTALEANKVIGRKGTFWETEYFDHIIQDEDELDQQIRYILDNPLKAGLTDWKWVWVNSEFCL
jgi:REP element-mobilizing transposase RayT